MTSLTFAMVVIVATFGIQSAFGFKDSLIQFARDTNLENNIVTLYNRDGKRGNVVVVEIRNKDDKSFTRIVTIRDKDTAISISSDKCIVTYQGENQGNCSELVRSPRDEVTREVDNECEGLDVYIERSKECNAVTPFGCYIIRVYVCWSCYVTSICCGWKTYLVCN